MPFQFVRATRWVQLGAASLVLCLCVAVPAHVAVSVRAGELVMFEMPACEWCEQWDAEVGVVYDKTRESRKAPLRRVFMHQPLPSDLQLLKTVHYSPTFVLLDGGIEVGRILGYPGEDHFWGLLNGLLEQIPEGPSS